VVDYFRGRGEVFRRNKERESLCTCHYDLMHTPDAPLSVSSFAKTDGLETSVTISGTITPTPPMTTTRLRAQADTSDMLELELADGRWLDFQFMSTRGNRVICSKGPRVQR
jgi:hypothetical protein